MFSWLFIVIITTKTLSLQNFEPEGCFQYVFHGAGQCASLPRKWQPRSRGDRHKQHCKSMLTKKGGGSKGYRCLLLGASVVLLVIHLHRLASTNSLLTASSMRNGCDGVVDADSLEASSEIAPFEHIATASNGNGKKYKVSERAALQIENYKQGTGLMLNIHITHHGMYALHSIVKWCISAYPSYIYILWFHQ